MPEITPTDLPELLIPSDGRPLRKHRSRRARRPANRREARPKPSGVSALTPQQKRVFDYIRDHMRDNNGQSPTLRGIAEALGFKSTNGATCHLRALMRKGVIRRDRGQARGILLAADEPLRVMRLADTVVLDCGDRVYELDPASAARLGRSLLVQAGVVADERFTR